MSRSQATILTNMCLIEDGRGNIVMQIRDPKRYSWSGAALPGGHIEAHEGLVESVIREVKEETGLTIKSPKLVGISTGTRQMTNGTWFSSIEPRILKGIFVQRKREKSGGLLERR